MANLACCGFSNICLLLCVLSSAIGTELGATYSEEQESPCRQDIVQDRLLNDVANGEAPLHEHSVSKRSTANVVDIAQFEDSSTPGKQFSVYVDETMTRLMIEVKVDRSNPVMMLTKPSGVPGTRPSLNTTTGTTFRVATVDTAITSADYGIWKIMKMDANKWHVKIQGESPLDFTYQFLEGTFIQMPITGDPIQGKSYKATIQVQEYSKIQKVDMVFLFIIAKSTPANMFPAKGLGSGKYSVDKMTMIDQEFMIGIQGKDNSGNFFRRLSSLIKPVTLSLSVPSYSGVKLYENTQLDIEFWVVNELSTDQDIDVRIVDTKKWAQAPIFISETLTPGQNFSGKFVIKAGAPGETTVATITARQYLGHGKGFSLGPSEVRQFTVERNDTTTTSTTTTSTSTSTSTTSVTQTTTTPTTITTSSSSLGISSTSAATKKSTVSSVASPGSTSGVISGNSSPPSSTAKVLSLGSTVSTANKASTSQTSATIPGPIVSSTAAKTLVTGSNVPKSLSTGKSTLTSTVVTGSSTVSLPKSGITVNTPKPTVKPSTSSSGVGKSSAITSTSKPKGGNHGVATHSSASASPVASAKTAGRTTIAAAVTGAEANDESGDSFNKGEVFAAAIGSGIGAGVLIGVAALVTMGLILKGGMNGKSAVSPHDQKKKTLEDLNRKQRTLSDHNKLAWT